MRVVGRIVLGVAVFLRKIVLSVDHLKLFGERWELADLNDFLPGGLGFPKVVEVF